MLHRKFKLFQREFDGWQLATVLVIVLGICLRTVQYLVNRSLWLDEALLALNIINRSPLDLLSPLDRDQVAPIGYLLIEKGMVILFGENEFSLRLFALLSGCASLILMAFVSNLVLKKPLALLALSLFAVGWFPIYFSSELKPYSSDVTVSLLLTLIAARYFQVDLDYRQSLILGIVGALTLWFSLPALFILAGIGCGLLYHRVANRRWNELLPLTLSGTFWFSSFVILYLVSLRYASSSNYLLEYWNEAFMPMPPWQELGWFPATLQGWVRNPVGLAGLTGKLASLLLLMGALQMLFTKPSWALMLAAPIAFVLLASGFQKYPATGRLILFMLPNLLLLIVGGVALLQPLLRRSWFVNSVMIIIAGALLWRPIISTTKHVLRPGMGEHIRPLVAELKSQLRNEDRIYVYYGATAAFDYYARVYGLLDKGYVAGVDARENPAAYLRDVDALEGRDRVWILFTHVYDQNGVNEERVIVEHLDEIGEMKYVTTAPGSTLYLYDLDGSDELGDAGVPKNSDDLGEEILSNVGAPAD